MGLQVSNAAAIVANDAVLALADAGAGAGYIEFRTGAAPANCIDASTSTLLATCVMSDPAFNGSTDNNPGAIATAASIGSDVSIDVTGLAAHFRLFDSDALCVMQGDVAGLSSGAIIELDDPNMVQGGTAAITSFNIRHPEGTV